MSFLALAYTECKKRPATMRAVKRGEEERGSKKGASVIATGVNRR